ncbi:MAG: nucleotidyltransferase domain-containing protein [Chloroflexi bacterium]|nr:nucleotidyltransferase domain-containing protein [Chloroflexota bacterium]
MVQLIADRAAELEELCRRCRVLRLDVFGSATDARRFRPESDLDFLVEFHPTLVSGRADAYFDLLFGLQDLFGRTVDLVMASAIHNPYFRESVEESRELVYAA